MSGRVIRDRAGEPYAEPDAATTRSVVVQEQARLDALRENARVLGPYGPRDSMAGDPASTSGTKIAESELDDALRGKIVGFGQTVTVAKSGGDFTSVAAAVGSIDDASNVKPYIVQVGPGVYIETPFAMKNYVDVIGVGGFFSTVLQTSDNANHFITGASASTIQNIAIDGPTNAGKAAVYYDEESLSAFILFQVLIRKGYYGVWANQAAALGIVHLFYVGNQYTGTAMNQFVRVTGYGKASAIDLGAPGPAPAFTDCIMCVEGPNAKLGIQNGTFIAGASVDSVRIDDGAFARISSCAFLGGHTAIRVGPTGSGSWFDAIGCSIDSSGHTVDIAIESAVAGLSTYQGKASRNQIVDASGLLRALFFDIAPGQDPSMTILGEMHVGTADLPFESAFGGGDSYTFDIQVHSYDASELSGSRFTDVTTAARSVSGSTFGFPAGAAVGDAIVLAAPRKFPGAKFAINTLMVKSVSTDEIVWEYWNGASWVAFNVMETDAGNGLVSNANDVWITDLEVQVRFDDAFLSSWVADDGVTDDIPPYGSDHYVVRARVATAPPSTEPLFEQVKLYPAGRTEINTTGTLEHFGAAEPVWARLFTQGIDFIKPSGASKPNDVNILVSSGITIPGLGNGFPGGALRELFFFFAIVDKLDTSRKFTFDAEFSQNDAGTGNVEWQYDIAIASPSHLHDGSLPEISLSAVHAVPGTQFQAFSIEIEVDLSVVTQGDAVYCRMYRDGGVGDDTYGGQIVLEELDIKSWRYA